MRLVEGTRTRVRSVPVCTRVYLCVPSKNACAYVCVLLPSFHQC